jgi:hypothetical protein
MSAKEKWITIKQNNNYEVSNYGNIRNKKTKRILKPAISNKGYYLVSLSNKGKTHTYTIHKLVMEHFNRCAFDYEVINHIDHNKLNNNVSNLEYVTQQENVKLAFENGRCENIKLKAKENILKASEREKIKINQYDKNGNFIKQWDYIRQIQYVLKINNANIVAVCKGKRKTAGGYIWRYANVG